MPGESVNQPINWLSVAEAVLRQEKLGTYTKNLLANRLLQVAIRNSESGVDTAACGSIIRRMQCVSYQTISLLLDLLVKEFNSIADDECYYTFVTVRRNPAITVRGAVASRNRCISKLSQLLFADAEQRRLVGIEGLGFCPPLPPHTVAALVRSLYDHSGRIKSAALDTLSVVSNTLMVDYCLALLSADDALVRRTSARLLRTALLPSEAVVQGLRQALRDQDDRVVFFAAESLASLFRDMPPPELEYLRQTLARLVAVLTDRELQQRASLLQTRLQAY